MFILLVSFSIVKYLTQNNEVFKLKVFLILFCLEKMFRLQSRLSFMCKIGKAHSFLLVLGVLFWNNQVRAQPNEIDSPTGIYGFIGVGSDSYSGDLSSYEKWSSSFRIGLKFNRHKRFNGNFMLSIGSLIGQDPFYSYNGSSQNVATPNSFTKTTFTSLNYEWQYNLLNLEQWKVYLSQGIGIFFFTPKDQFNDELFDQNNTRETNEVYGGAALFIPTAIGIRHILRNQIGIESRFSIANTSSDYLDNISLWGNKEGNDNAISFQVLLLIPFK